MEGPIVTKPTAVIIEMDEERDRKACIALDLKVTAANRELAQWLLDHPQYTAPQAAAWLGRGRSRIKIFGPGPRMGLLWAPCAG
jgi:hypothetical protein